MMDTVTLKKTLTVELDIVSGEIRFYNPDEIAYLEMLGMIEYVKMMVIDDWLKER
jgi:hypothetical protein